MVLTNIGLWAADGSSGSSLPIDFESNNPHARHLNPFDPRIVPQMNSNLNHLSSNGYYGFSYINAAHDTEINNNNNHNSINNNNISDINHFSNNNNNNNSATHNTIPNDDYGMNTTFPTATTTTPAAIQQTLALSVNFGSASYGAGNATNVVRCKKRFFVMNDGDDDEDDASECTATKNKNSYSNNGRVAAKRCRFDGDFSAQYCHDFFQLPSTQIATQSCLMDTEEGMQQQLQQQQLQPHQHQQQQQQQLDVAMFENNNNIEKYEQKSNNPQLTPLNAHHQQQQSQQQLQSQQPQQQQQQQLQQQQHLYHQQQHYQDIQFATIKCHFNHSNNNNNNCDTIALNNRTCKIDLKKNTENVLGIHNANLTSSIQNERDKYENENDDGDGVAANDFKVDDATLFAQLHGGCLHHHEHHHFNSTVSFSGDYQMSKKMH